MSSRLDELERDINLAIGATDDPKDRAMLMLMQKILVHVEKLLSDEEMLRMKVLNGDYPTHTEDHEVMQTLVKLDIVSAVQWVNNRKNNSGGYCDYAHRKLAQEKEIEDTNKSRINKFIDSTISELPRAVLFAAVTLAGYGWLIR